MGSCLILPSLFISRVWTDLGSQEPVVGVRSSEHQPSKGLNCAFMPWQYQAHQSQPPRALATIKSAQALRTGDILIYVTDDI